MTKEAAERQHVATFSFNQRAQQYNVRVVGPHADKFAGREIPVSRLNKPDSIEKLTRMLKSGIDEGKVVPENKGKMYALYSFVQKPRAVEEEEQEIKF